MAGAVGVRQASRAQAGAALPLLVRFFAEEGFDTPPPQINAQLLAMLDEPSSAVFLAWLGEQAVGVATVTTSAGIELGLSAELEDLYVLPTARGRGVAGDLIEAVAEWCRARGCTVVSIVVTPEGQAAHDLIGYYRHRGFATTGRTILLRALPPPALHTARLALIPATAALLRAELDSPAALVAALGAEVPDNWPPETLADALPFFLQQLEAAPELAGWLGWYWLWQRGPQTAPLLVGSGGFKGQPQADGTVEIGYSVLPQFQGQGYASEAAARLIAWALTRPGVERVIAETLEENLASRRVLAKLGFRPAGPGSEPGSLLFELTSAARSSIIFSMTDGRE